MSTNSLPAAPVNAPSPLSLEQKLIAEMKAFMGAIGPATPSVPSPANFYDNGGGATFNLATSHISNNIHLSPIGFAPLNVMDGQYLATSATAAATASVAAWDKYTTATAHGDVVNLNPTGTGVNNITAPDNGSFSTIAGFELGRDLIDMALLSKGGSGYALHDFTIGGKPAVAITNVDKAAPSSTLNGNAGVVLLGMTSANLAGHMSTGTFGGALHLYIH